jgi:pyruvate formate lyase activating enzyme
VSTSTSLRVGGLSPLSSVDWPGELAATVFLQGCPWRCPYCHNPHLLGATGGDDLAWDGVVDFLRARVGLLDGVVFTGGEPTVQAGLADAIAEVRELGFRVALHTGGPVPERVREVLPLLDWIGFDLKAPFAEYERITRVAGSGEAARESLVAVLASGVAYEVRTTVHPALLDDDALLRMADKLAEMGVAQWVLQPFRVEGCGDEGLVAQPPAALRLSPELASHALPVSIRS